MKDPKRLIEGGGSDLSAELLRSWRQQRPSAAARLRTTAALGLGASVGATASAAGAAGASQTAAAVGKGLGAGSALSGAASTTTLASKGIVLKWLAGGLMAGSIGAVTVEHVVLEPSTSTPTATAVAAPQQGGPSLRPAAMPRGGSARGTPEPEIEPTAAPPAPAVVTTSLPPRAAFGALPPRGGQATALASPAEGPTEKPSDETTELNLERSSLSQEVAAVEQARRALATRDPQGALRALDRYHALNPSAALGPEAALLRIEALDHLGEHAQASQLAQGFLNRFPRSPHQQRLRRIAAQPGSSNP